MCMSRYIFLPSIPLRALSFSPQSPHSHSHSHGSSNRHPKHRPSEFDMDKLRSTMKQLVRDWSEEVSCVLCFEMRILNVTLVGSSRA